MATAEQIRANRENARKSTGPKDTDRTRFNGLKHGLRAEQVVLPGEDPAAFEAERQAWFDDWKPLSHTRAVLVERAAVAAWKLRRATRVEAARLHEPAADTAHDFDTERRQVVECALSLLPRDPATAVARLRSDIAGMECLIGLWDDLVRAVDAGWTSRTDHHDRLVNLLGLPAGSEAKGPEAVGASLALLRGHDPAAAATLRSLCAARLAELREERSKYLDLPQLRQRLIDAACAPTSKDAQLMHRYEMAHEQSLRSAIRGLLTLEKHGADIPEPSPAPAPEAAPEPKAQTAGQATPDKSATNHRTEKSSGDLASVGEATPAMGGPGTSAGPRGRRKGPIAVPSGPREAPARR